MNEPMPIGEPTSPIGGEMNQQVGGDIYAINGDGVFNADVEADVDSDPKKYLQQLTGKLSQELRNYNNNQPNQDTELNKYIAGMIIPQAAKSMTDDDKSEVIKKIKQGVTDDGELENNMETESLSKRDKLVNEIVNSVLGNEKKDEKRFEKKTTNVKKNNPFVSNR